MELLIPGGLAVVDETLVVADLQSLRGVDIATRKDAWVLRNIFASSPLGTTTAVANHGENLLLTSWLDNTVKILDPKTGEIVQSIEDWEHLYRLFHLASITPSHCMLIRRSRF